MGNTFLWLQRPLTLSWGGPLSYINLLRKSMDWFLCDNNLGHERVNHIFEVYFLWLSSTSVNIYILGNLQWYKNSDQTQTLREKYLYSEFFWSVFFRIRTDNVLRSSLRYCWHISGQFSFSLPPQGNFLCFQGYIKRTLVWYGLCKSSAKPFQQIEVAVWRCFSEQVFLKISQYSLENTCVGVLF